MGIIPTPGNALVFLYQTALDKFPALRPVDNQTVRAVFNALFCETALPPAIGKEVEGTIAEQAVLLLVHLVAGIVATGLISKKTVRVFHKSISLQLTAHGQAGGLGLHKLQLAIVGVATLNEQSAANGIAIHIKAEISRNTIQSHATYSGAHGGTIGAVG